MATEDDDLFERLGQALPTPEAEPSESELAALRRAVGEQRSSVVARRAWPRRVAAGLAAAAVLVVVVIAPPLPEPVRRVAHGLGLPVDSVEVADAKSALAQLTAALDEGDPAKVARARARARERMERLGEGDRRRLASRADPLFERSRRFEGGAGAGTPPGQLPRPSGGPTTTGPTTRPQPSTSTPTTSTTTMGGTSTTTGRTTTTR